MIIKEDKLNLIKSFNSNESQYIFQYYANTKRIAKEIKTLNKINIDEKEIDNNQEKYSKKSCGLLLTYKDVKMEKGDMKLFYHM